MNKAKLFTGLLAVVLIWMAGCNEDDESNVKVTSAVITDISTTTAIGGGTVEGPDAASVMERGVCWSENPGPTTAGTKAKDASGGAGSFVVLLKGLSNNTTYYARTYAKANGRSYYGEEMTFTTFQSIELIANGDFSNPADENVKDVNAAPPWRTDETNMAWVTRSKDYWDPTNYTTLTNDWAKSIYQVVGIVPSVETEYEFRFDTNWYWTNWGDYKPTTSVIFSAYSGDDPSTREIIGTVDIIEPAFFPGWGNNWGSKSGSFTLTKEKAAEFAGKKLVIEFDVLPYIGDYNDQDVWFDLDNISVKQL